MADKINAQEGKWTIRGYTAGDYYATVFCPHGRPVEVINTDLNGDGRGDLFFPRSALAEWMRQTVFWRNTYCHGHHY